MRFTALALLMIMTFALSAQQVVSYDKSDEVDFSKYKSFRFYKLDVSSKELLESNNKGITNIKDAIVSELARRSMTFIEDGDADILINLGLSITTEVQTRETDIRDAPIYVGTRNYHWESEEIVVGEYQAGTITIDMIDASKNEMVWQGVVTGVLNKKSEKNMKTADKAIFKIFKKYPIKPSKK